MRVLLSAGSFHPDFGGPARSVPQLAAALAEKGVEVGLWAPDGSSLTSPLLQGMVNVTRLGGGPAEAWRSFGTVDVLHDNGIWRSHHQQLARLAKNASVPRVVSTRGMLEPWALAHKPVRKRIAWWVFQKKALEAATVLHSTANSEAGQLAGLGLQRPTRIVPNGVNMPDMTLVEKLRSAPKETRSCLFLSRIHPKKGLPLLLKAWDEVRPAGWQLHIAGPDEAGHRGELESMVGKLDLKGLVHFLGPLEGQEKMRSLACADLMVLPTHSENFGIVVAEALAHGCPVITTQGAPWEALKTDRCGWWVPVSTGPIADALREATAMSIKARREMGSRGRALVAQRFAWGGIAQAFKEIYEEAIALQVGGR